MTWVMSSAVDITAGDVDWNNLCGFAVAEIAGFRCSLSPGHTGQHECLVGFDLFTSAGPGRPWINAGVVGA